MRGRLQWKLSMKACPVFYFPQPEYPINGIPQKSARRGFPQLPFFADILQASAIPFANKTYNHSLRNAKANESQYLHPIQVLAFA